MTEPDTTAMDALDPRPRGMIPVYLKIGDGDVQHIGAFHMPEQEQPTNTDVAALLRQIANMLELTPDGVNAPSLVSIVQR